MSNLGINNVALAKWMDFHDDKQVIFIFLMPFHVFMCILIDKYSFSLTVGEAAKKVCF